MPLADLSPSCNFWSALRSCNKSARPIYESSITLSPLSTIFLESDCAIVVSQMELPLTVSATKSITLPDFCTLNCGAVIGSGAAVVIDRIVCFGAGSRLEIGDCVGGPCVFTDAGEGEGVDLLIGLSKSF